MENIIFDCDKFCENLPEDLREHTASILKAIIKTLDIQFEDESTPTINHSKDESSGVDYSIKSDKGKYCPTLCHKSLIEAVSRVREFGVSRYGGTETWKRVEEQRYKDACYRHWLAYLEDPDGVDEESGLLHLWHVACNVDFLVEMQKEKIKKNETD